MFDFFLSPQNYPFCTPYHNQTHGKLSLWFVCKIWRERENSNKITSWARQATKIKFIYLDTEHWTEAPLGHTNQITFRVFVLLLSHWMATVSKLHLENDEIWTIAFNWKSSAKWVICLAAFDAITHGAELHSCCYIINQCIIHEQNVLFFGSKMFNSPFFPNWIAHCLACLIILRLHCWLLSRFSLLLYCIPCVVCFVCSFFVVVGRNSMKSRRKCIVSFDTLWARLWVWMSQCIADKNQVHSFLNWNLTCATCISWRVFFGCHAIFWEIEAHLKIQAGGNW